MPLDQGTIGGDTVAVKTDTLATALDCVQRQIVATAKADRTELLSALLVISIAMLRQIEEPAFVRGLIHRAVIDMNRPRPAQFDFLDE